MLEGKVSELETALSDAEAAVAKSKADVDAKQETFNNAKQTAETAKADYDNANTAKETAQETYDLADQAQKDAQTAYNNASDFGLAAMNKAVSELDVAKANTKTLEEALKVAKETADAVDVKLAEGDVNFYKWMMDKGYLYNGTFNTPDGTFDAVGLAELKNSKYKFTTPTGTIEDMKHALNFFKKVNELRVASNLAEVVVDPLAMVFAGYQNLQTTKIGTHAIESLSMWLNHSDSYGYGSNSYGENIAYGYTAETATVGLFTDEGTIYADFIVDHPSAVPWRDGVTEDQKTAILNKIKNTTKDSNGFYSDELLCELASLFKGSEAKKRYTDNGGTEEVGHFTSTVSEQFTFAGAAYNENLAKGRYQGITTMDFGKGSFRNLPGSQQMSVSEYQDVLTSYVNELESQKNAYNEAYAKVTGAKEAEAKAQAEVDKLVKEGIVWVDGAEGGKYEVTDKYLASQKTSLEKANKALSDATTALDNAKKDVASAQTTYDNATASLEKATTALKEATNAYNKVVEDENVDGLKSDLTNAKSDLVSTKSKQDETKKTLSEKKNELDAVTAEVNASDSEKTKVQASLTDANSALAKADEAYKNAVEALTNAQNEFDSLSSENKTVIDTYNNAADAYEKAKTAMNNATSERDVAKSAYDKAMAAENDAKQNVSAKTQAFTNATTALADAQKSVTTAQDTYDATEKAYQSAVEAKTLAEKAYAEKTEAFNNATTINDAAQADLTKAIEAYNTAMANLAGRQFELSEATSDEEAKAKYLEMFSDEAITDLAFKVSEAKENLEKAKSALEEKKKAAETALTSLTQAQTKLAAAEDARDAAITDRDTKKTAFDAATKKLNDAKAKLAGIQEAKKAAEKAMNEKVITYGRKKPSRSQSTSTTKTSVKPTENKSVENNVTAEEKDAETEEKENTVTEEKKTEEKSDTQKETTNKTDSTKETVVENQTNFTPYFVGAGGLVVAGAVVYLIGKKKKKQ